MGQQVKHFKSKQAVSNDWFGANDRGLAKQIETYATSNNLHIDSIAYHITRRYMHAMVVMSDRQPATRARVA